MIEHGKLKPLAEQVLIGEIVMQSKFAAMAADHLAEASDPTATWGCIQAILVAAANVSKILWPGNNARKARGERLRTLLGVGDRNLLSDRTFRNHFEHYDERVEDWLQENPSSVYSDSRIDSFEPIWGSSHCHRSYNPVTQELTFRGESLNIGAVVRAIEEIQCTCKAFALP